MKKIILSTVAAAALATSALSFAATDASAGYYGFKKHYTYNYNYYKPVCFTKYRTVSYKKKIRVRDHHGWGYGYGYRWIWKTFYKKVPYKVCHKGY